MSKTSPVIYTKFATHDPYDVKMKYVQGYRVVPFFKILYIHISCDKAGIVGILITISDSSCLFEHYFFNSLEHKLSQRRARLANIQAQQESIKAAKKDMSEKETQKLQNQMVSAHVTKLN